MKDVSDRGFEAMTASDPTDQFHRVRIECSHKGCSNAMIFSRRGPINPVHAAKWFRDKGWHVGGHPRADLCPEHKNGETKMKRGPKPKGYWVEALANQAAQVSEVAEEISAQVLEPLPEPVQPEAPVSMSKIEKRLIFSRLDEVYADETTGYRGDWSDEKLAKDLGVPKEWIVEIREDAFGPEYTRRNLMENIIGQAAEVKAKLDEYLETVKMVQQCKEGYDNAVATMDAVLADFDERLAEMSNRLMVFNQMYEDLEKNNG